MQLKVVGGVIVGAAVVAATGVIAQAGSKKAPLGGGLAVANSQIERPAQAGAKNEVTVLNRSKDALTITVSARPWRQSSSGTVAPNRRSTLRDVELSDSEFTLAPGAQKTVAVTLKTDRSQYGALEIVGLPTNVAKRKGVIPGYRLVSALRYTPATPTHALKVGSAKVTGDMLTLSVKNTGNTADPVTGSVRLKGPVGTRHSAVHATRVLPGKTLRLPLVSTKRLAAGRYTATISLKQGKFKTSLTKKVRVR